MKALTALAVFLCLCIAPIYADYYCTLDDRYWFCDYGCCYSFYGCCPAFASVYWYAWLIIVLVILGCCSACAGCCCYGYRRHHHQVYVPITTSVPATTTVFSHPVAHAPPQYQAVSASTDPYGKY